MPTKNPSRESHFPAIEKKYGQPMSYWFDVMAELSDEKYPEQVEYLRANYGFSQSHANALVMYSRGSTSSKRFAKPSEYFKTLSTQQAKTARAIFKIIQTKYPELELVIAWNQPMLRKDTSYVFGLSAATNHLLLAPWSKDAIEKFTPKMKDLDVKKKTIGVPNNWTPDEKLLLGLVKFRLSEL